VRRRLHLSLTKEAERERADSAVPRSQIDDRPQRRRHARACNRRRRHPQSIGWQVTRIRAVATTERSRERCRPCRQTLPRGSVEARRGCSGRKAWLSGTEAGPARESTTAAPARAMDSALLRKRALAGGHRRARPGGSRKSARWTPIDRREIRSWPPSSAHRRVSQPR
jgi:hypothetical protein